MRNNMYRNLSKLTLIFFLFSLNVSAQYFSTGQDPSHIKWRQINTDHFQLIYPDDYEEKAQQLAFVFEKVYRHGTKALNHEPKKISVVLHTHTVKSNGLVSWSPKRVELFTTPHQKTYSQDWLEQLAIHEFRHVVQMDKIQSELPGILPVLFGEQAAAAAVAAYLPFWFIEGDAVVAETALTNSGRGRLASFLMENKAQLVEKGMYNYDKASLGSYRDFVPNRYRFGYWLAGAIREEYGFDIWSEVLEEIGQKPFSLNPLNRVLKRRTGLKKDQLYQQIFMKYKMNWNEKIKTRSLTKNIKLSPENRFYTKYINGCVLSDSSMVALKKSRDDIDRIVIVKNGREETVFTPGSILDESFSAKENLLIWSERRPDLRWSHADASLVVLYNLDTQIRNQFRFENNLFSPAISPDLTRFVAVEVGKSNQYFLSVFDLNTGTKIKSYSNPDNYYLYTPCWNDRGDEIYFVSLSEKGKSLNMLSIDNGKIEMLEHAGFRDLRNPFFNKEKIYFTDSYSGVDNICSYDLRSAEIQQISSVSFGADYASIIGDSLCFSNYSSDGYHLAKMNLSELNGTMMKETRPHVYQLAENLTAQEDTILTFSEKDQVQFESKPYSKAAHLFNFHSWAPAYVNVDDYEIKPGVSLFSQNKLGTAETELGYEYNLSEKTGKYKLGFKYSGFFPVIESDLAFGKRKSQYYMIQNTVNQQGIVVRSDTTLHDFSWNELELDLKLQVPLTFSNGKYTQLLKPALEYSYRNISHDSSTPKEYYSGHYQTLTSRLYFQNILTKSELAIYPKWGQIVEGFYRTSIIGSDVGDLKAIHSYLYLPGLASNHGLRFYNGYQEKDDQSNISFSDILSYPRGSQRFQNNQLYTFKSDYAFPIAYPDLSLGSLVYLKRLRASIFYDYAYLKGNLFNQDQKVVGTFSGDIQGIGVELYGDGHLLRLVAPISTGLRGVYRPNTKDFVVEFLFTIQFDGI